MMISHIVVAGIVGHYDGNFKVPGGAAAGWVGVVFIYVRSYSILHALISDDAFSDLRSQFHVFLGPRCMARVRRNLLSWSPQPGRQHYYLL